MMVRRLLRRPLLIAFCHRQYAETSIAIQEFICSNSPYAGYLGPCGFAGLPSICQAAFDIPAQMERMRGQKLIRIREAENG